MDLSVIIPVYNVQDYLRKCVDSVIAQQIASCEIILVDDGSTDASSEICDEMDKKYSSVTVIHQQNKGLSEARNAGLRAATGKYLSFVDSDDYIYKNGLKELLDCAMLTHAEVVAGRALKFGLNETKDVIQSFLANGLYTGEQYFLEVLKAQRYYPCAPYFLYKREFLVENNLSFIAGLYHEDHDWTPRVLLCAQKLQQTDALFYVHVERLGSITRSKTKDKNAKDLLQICSRLIEVANTLENVELKDLFSDYIAMLYMHAFFIGKLYGKKGEVIFDKKLPQKLSSTPKNKFKASLLRISPRSYYAINYVVKRMTN